MSEEELELYGDPGIASYNAKVPKFLYFVYGILPIWGIIALVVLWNGTTGTWMDPGYWHDLQIAANTTYPMRNIDTPNETNKSLQELEKKEEAHD